MYSRNVIFFVARNIILLTGDVSAVTGRLRLEESLVHSTQLSWLVEVRTISQLVLSGTEGPREGAHPVFDY